MTTYAIGDIHAHLQAIGIIYSHDKECYLYKIK